MSGTRRTRTMSHILAKIYYCPVATLRGRGLCPGYAPAGKPSSMQYQFFAFRRTILHTNRGQLFGAHGIRRYDFESKFSKPFPVRHTAVTAPSLRDGATPSRAHPYTPQHGQTSTALAVRGAAQALLCWDLDHRAP